MQIKCIKLILKIKKVLKISKYQNIKSYIILVSNIMYLVTSKCFQCNDHIKNGNTIYRGYDRTFCSKYCLSIQYKRISEFDPQFKSHYIWHSPNSEIQKIQENVEDISNTQPLKKRKTVSTLPEITILLSEISQLPELVLPTPILPEINNLDSKLEQEITILLSEISQLPELVLPTSTCSNIVPLIINSGIQIKEKIYEYILTK